MRQYTIHIPTVYNDGRVVSAGTLKLLQTMALEKFGGFTFNPGPLLGGWKDQKTGQVYIEPVCQMIIASDDHQSIHDYAHDIGIVLEQITMYVWDGVLVTFIDTAKDDEARHDA